jgi:hypothetical protein
MGRRKRQLLDDGDSDSSAHSEAEDFGDENQDIRDERALFENPYQQNGANSKSGLLVMTVTKKTRMLDHHENGRIGPKLLLLFPLKRWSLTNLWM